MYPVALAPQGTGGPRAPHFYKWLGRGHRKQKNSKKETDQTVYTDHHESAHQNILLQPKKWRGTTKLKFFGTLRRIGAPPLQRRTGAPPTLKFVPAPLNVSSQFPRCADVVISDNVTHDVNKFNFVRLDYTGLYSRRASPYMTPRPSPRDLNRIYYTHRVHGDSEHARTPSYTFPELHRVFRELNT